MQFCPAGNSQSKPPFLSVLELFYSSSRNRDKAMDVLCSDGSSPKRSSPGRALKVKIEPSQAHPKPRPFKQSQAQALKGLYLFLLLHKNSNFLCPSQKVKLKPGSSLGPSQNFEPKPQKNGRAPGRDRAGTGLWPITSAVVGRWRLDPWLDLTFM